MTRSNSQTRTIRWLIAASLGTFIILFGAFYGANLLFDLTLNGSPWQLSARNTDNGVVVEIHEAENEAPTYTAELNGHIIDHDVDRVEREDLPADIATTLFYDDTLRPGRWQVRIDGVKLDIMERALIIDDKTQILPSPR